MESGDSPEDLQKHFYDGLCEDPDHLKRLGLAEADLQGKMPDELLNLLNRKGREQNLTVMLLLDEAEVWVELAATPEGNALLVRLQREIQNSDHLRVAVGANRQLLKLHQDCQGYPTSKILECVVTRYLGRLEHAEAVALIRQGQSPPPQTVDDAAVEAIIAATGGHPWLTQLLCDRLWSPQGLRAPTDDDLLPDDNLSTIFRIDIQGLSPDEIGILRTLAGAATLDEASLLSKLAVKLPLIRFRSLVQPLIQLGYLQKSDAGYAIGNKFLDNWLQAADPTDFQTEVSSEAAADLADEDIMAQRQLIETHQRVLNVLELQQAQLGANTPPNVVLEIADRQKAIKDCETAIEQIRANRQTASTPAAAASNP
jgi:hypothetical protein